MVPAPQRRGPDRAFGGDRCFLELLPVDGRRHGPGVREDRGRAEPTELPRWAARGAKLRDDRSLSRFPGRRDGLALDGQLPVRAHRSDLDRKRGKPRPEAACVSARELLAWLDVAGKKLAKGYQGSAIPILEERFAEARRKLEALSR